MGTRIIAVGADWSGKGKPNIFRSFHSQMRISPTIFARAPRNIMT